MRKAIGIILAIAALLVGLRFGIIAALVGAGLAAFFLKYFGVVSPNSAWVSETNGVKIAKYILLAIVALGLVGFAYVAFYQ